ncbi:hypothetical protein [Arsenophonus endosymbiont of Crataerina pallida]|uniref:hypothetical protein n=1 Tax=Arsenophonus endosymbiont of Crataerina pallida TaxID=3066235 RepID=UPI0030CE6C4A
MFPINNLSTVAHVALPNKNDPTNMLLQQLISSSAHIQGETRLLPNGLTARDNFPLLFQVVLDPVNEQPEINGFQPSHDFNSLYPMIGKQGETTIVAGNYDEIVRYVSCNQAYAVFAIAALGLPAVSLKQNFDDPDTSAIALLFSVTGSLERAISFDETHILGPVDPERVVLLHAPYSNINTLQLEVAENLSRTYQQVVNKYMNSSNHSTFDIWFSLYPQYEALSSYFIGNELTQQQITNGNLERKVESNNIPHNSLTENTHLAHTMVNGEKIRSVTPEILKEIVLLGAKGIAKAGGLTRLSEKYNVNLSTLNNYLHADGTLTVRGKVFLGGKSNKLTPELLKEMASLGAEGIAKAGGLRRLSQQYNVNLHTLNSYLNKKGTLTVNGKNFLGDKSSKLTPELLETIASLDAEEFTKAGGLTGLSEQYNVNLTTLNNYLDKNGMLKVRGKIFLSGKSNKITPELLQKIASLGAEGFVIAGGLRGISEQYNVNLATLNNYVDKNGTFTVRGKSFLGNKSNKITPRLLKTIASLGEEGIAKAGGLIGISKQYKVNLSTLKSYLDKNGMLTMRGRRFLETR